MNSERFEELALLAESIAEENSHNGKTDLLSIIYKKKIQLISGNYEDCFLGNLVHDTDRFYLYLNMDLLSANHNPRIRFTIAHELAHYFIDEHRNLLKQGISLSFNKEHSNFYIEKEANHFASFLLMPRERFRGRAAAHEPGLPAILNLSNEFETSIDCTSIHYSMLDCSAGLLVRWNENDTIKFYCVSKTLSDLINLNSKPIIKINTSYLAMIKKELMERENPYEIIEKATTLTQWVATIPPDSKSNLTALEQTIKLGTYGGMTYINYFPK